MNRCPNPAALSALSTPKARPGESRAAQAPMVRALLPVLLLATTSWATAQAQPVRNFPESALRAKMVVVQPPEITLNGEPARLSPGARIRSQSNSLLLSGSVVGQELVVNYVRDLQGLVHEVWVLNPAEAAQKRAGGATERNFRFASEGTPTPNAPGAN